MPKREKPKQFKFKAKDGSEYVIGDGGKSLELTSEKLAESIKNQAVWAESSPHLQLDVHMAAIAQARRVAPDWLEGLRQVDIELHQPHTKAERKDLRRLFDHYSKLLAEALATMGEFEDALSVLPKSEVALRKEYTAILEAVWKDDGARCGEKCEQAVAANPNLVTHERVHSFVFSKKHGKVMPAIKCAHCGMINVRPMDGTLLARHQARKQADEIIKGKSPADAVSALRDARLTAQHVLKT